MSYCIQARHDLVPMNPNFEVLVDGMISPLRLATLRFPKTIKVPPLRGCYWREKFCGRVKQSGFLHWEKQRENRPEICPNYFLKYVLNVTNIS